MIEIEELRRVFLVLLVVVVGAIVGIGVIYLGHSSNVKLISSALKTFAGAGWITNTSYPISIQAHDCNILTANYIYCVGGLSSGITNGVYVAGITGASIGSWSATLNYPTNIIYTACTNDTNSGYVYCMAGDPFAAISQTNAIYAGSVSGGSITAWDGPLQYPIPVYALACAYYSNYLYCVGGVNSTSTSNNVYSAHVTGAGPSLGGWIAQPSYPTPVEAQDCEVSYGYIYCVGGDDAGTNTDFNAVYSASLSSGTVGSWTKQTQYPVNLSNMNSECAINSNTIYCIGGSLQGNIGTSAVYAAPISAGTVGAWTAQISYPTPIYYSSCVPYSNSVYCIGGTNGISTLSNSYGGTLTNLQMNAGSGILVNYSKNGGQLANTAGSSGSIAIGIIFAVFILIVAGVIIKKAREND